MTVTCIRQRLGRVSYPHGTQVRRLVALFGIGMGLGRLADYGATASIGFSQSEVFGVLLMLGGLALALTATPERRLTRAGRLAACWAVFTFSFMAAGTWGNTAAIFYAMCAAACFAEAIARRQDDC
jgi:hypothetical protein